MESSGLRENMLLRVLGDYFCFLRDNRGVYFVFNRQLLVGGLAGLLSGIAVAEVASLVTDDEILISISSGVVDYTFSIIGFLVVYYYDNKSQFLYITSGSKRALKITRRAVGLWPTVLAGDIAYIIARPYTHTILLYVGFEAGIAAMIAHFIGVGIFNGFAILSRSMIDFVRESRHESQGSDK